MSVYVKFKSYVGIPASIPTLEQNITRVVRQLLVEKLERVIEKWTQRMDHLRRIRCQYEVSVYKKNLDWDEDKKLSV